MSKGKAKDWTTRHDDGVSPLTMIGRPVVLRDNQPIVPPMIVQQHTLEVSAWVDGKLVGHVQENEDAHYPDDGIPYVYDVRAGIVKALRGLADQIEADVPTGDWP